MASNVQLNETNMPNSTGPQASINGASHDNEPSTASKATTRQGSSSSNCFRWLRRILRRQRRPHTSWSAQPASPPSDREIIRILMVGKGDVGKSTIIKQIQNLCNDNPNKYTMYDETWTTRLPTFTIAQRSAKKNQVLRNILHCIGTLLNKVDDYGYSYSSIENKNIADRLSEQIGDVDTVLRRQNIELTPEMASDIALLWQDSGVQDAWAKRTEYLIPDHATEYFLASQKLKEIATPGYIPSADDILRARNPTRGTCDYNFEIEGTKFHFRDMGGQPVEITRFPVVVEDWLSEFGEHSRKYILYVASLADYNQRLPSNPQYTQLMESIRIMQILMDIESLRNTGFILFLNKRDWLENKLKKFKDFGEHFPDNHLQLPTVRAVHKARVKQQQQIVPTVEQAEKIIGNSFHTAAQQTHRRDRPLYMHFTCATDKAQMDGIIGAVRVDILFKYMQTGIPFP